MSDDKPTETEAKDAPSEETEKETDETEAESESDAEAAPSSEKSSEKSSDEERPREKRSGKSKKRRERERAAAAAAAAQRSSSSNALMFAVAGLAAGAAVGWFGHIAQAKAKLKTDIMPTAAASHSGPSMTKSAPCSALEKELCSKTGETSAACAQAKSATDLLTSGTCEVALDAVPAMVEKVKAARAVCDTLVARLCKDLTPVSNACAMVKERTPSFPPERCKELSSNYEQVLTELKQMEEQGQIPGSPGAQGHGGPPPGGMPPGHGPGDGHGH